MARLLSAAFKLAPVRLWAMILAGPVATGSTAALVALVWSERWPLDLRGKQLDFLGWAMLGTLGINAVIVITLAAVRVRASAPGGASLEISGDDNDRPA